MSNAARHFISVDDFSLSDYAAIFEDAAAIKKGWGRLSPPQQTNKLVSLLFAQPSPRTSMSFDKACGMFGHRVSCIFTETSALAKGESFEDVMRMVGLGSDLVVVRHPENDHLIRHVAEHIYPMHKELAGIPIINAGGKDEHPTQALMDLFTIQEAFGRCDVTIGFYGDLRNDHSVRSLLKLLPRFGAKAICVAGDRGLEAPDSLLHAFAEKAGYHPVVKSVMEPFLGEIDVLYVTRIWREFSSDEVHHRYNNQLSPYRVRPEWLKKMRDDAIIMHPLPRLDELPTEIDSDKRARYVTQAHNGLFSRMALIRHCLNAGLSEMGPVVSGI